MILTCLAFSFISCLLPHWREGCILFCQKKKCHSLQAGFVRPAERLQWNWFSFIRPFISYKGKLSTPSSILSSGSVGPPWESKTSLHVVCRLEVALFTALPRQSIREKEALSVPPCSLSPLFWQTAENPSGIPLVGNFSSQKADVIHFRRWQACPCDVFQV